MKIIMLILMTAAVALGQPHIVGISPPVLNDPPFSPYVYIFAEQLANKSVTIEASPLHNFQSSYTLAFYACYTERQVVVATAPVGGPFQFQFFRARNDPCNGMAAAQGARQPVTEWEAEIRIPFKGEVWKPVVFLGEQNGVKSYVVETVELGL